MQNELDKPYPGVHEAFDAMHEQGFKIVIYSCNNPAYIRQRCEEWNLRPDKIWGESPEDIGKPVACLYADDRGYRFRGNWAFEIDEILVRAGARPVRRH